MKCPCCGNYTHIGEKEKDKLFQICKVCFWQYDEVAQNHPFEILGANNVSIMEAQENYKKFGVSEIEFKDRVRQPFVEELPENN